MDYYAAAMSLMYIAFFECVAVLWIYGTKRMSANIKDMTGSYPNIIYRLCWRYISPLLIFVSTYLKYCNCIRAIKGHAQLVAVPLSFQAKYSLLCAFYVVI